MTDGTRALLRRWWTATGLVATLALVGCGLSVGSAVVSSSDLNGVRSDADHQGLVISYTGGGCDGPARLRVKETATRIDADVVVGPGRGGACASVGYLRTLGARLAQPIGQRTIWSSGHEQIPFDGADLLVPSELPPGFGTVLERGFADRTTSDPEVAMETTTWEVRRSGETTAASGECQPTRGTLEIRLLPASVNRYAQETKVGTVQVGTAKARLYRDGGSRDRGWAYVWTVGRRSVEVASGPACTGDRPLDRTELLHVAESLRPA